MAERSEEFVIEVESGIGDPAFITLRRGTVLNPMSVGVRGMWRVDADDVLDVHGYVYFDGQLFFVQSADEEYPLLVQGQPVEQSWTSVDPPCKIQMGAARLHYRGAYAEIKSSADQETRVLSQPPVAKPVRPAAFAKSQKETTRVHSLDTTAPGARAKRRTATGASTEPPPPPPPASQATVLLPGATPQQPRPAAGAPAVQPRLQVPAGATRTQPPIYQGQMPLVAPGGQMPIGTSGAPYAAPPASRVPACEPSFKEQWAALSGPKKILVGMLPLLLGAFYILFVREDAPMPAPVPPKAASDAAVALTAPPRVSAALPTGPTPSFLQPPLASAPTLVPPVVSAPTQTIAPVGSTPAQRTLERLAIDYVANGQYERAAGMYDQLAAMYPDKPAYREAARILRAKLDGGT